MKLSRFAVLALTLTPYLAGPANAGITGFLCKGKYLFNTSSPAYVTDFDNATDCQVAVNDSKNGFLCKAQYLFNTGSPAYVTDFDNATDCQVSVNTSR